MRGYIFMDNNHGYPSQANGNHNRSSSLSSSSLSASDTSLPDSRSSSPVACLSSSSSAHAINSDSKRRHKDKRNQDCVHKPGKISGLGNTTSSPNNTMGNCDSDLHKPSCEPEMENSCERSLEMLAPHKSTANAEQDGQGNAFLRSAHNKATTSAEQDIFGADRTDSPCNNRPDHEKSNAEILSSHCGHHASSDVEPIQHQNSDQFWPLEPSLSAPPGVLMGLLPQPDVGREPSSPAPLVVVKMESTQPTSPTGLQRAQTLPSGSLETTDGTDMINKEDELLSSSTGKEKGKEADNVRTAGGKLSKRKQRKMMKRIATVNPNGTVEFDANKSARFAPDLFGPEVLDFGYDVSYDGDEEERRAIPPLQIAILIVGTQGDVQPFVAIGKHLQEYGHRVRLATHSNFREFVLKAGLEFFPLGGDPKVLAGYMVKNKGFLPSGPSEIRTQRKQLKSIINSLLPACIESDEDASVAFRAQAIIANPPCYGHAHVAEALKVPLHVFFTMPWTPTSEFPHPLSRVHHSAANRLSYQVVDSLIWWGIRDIVNDFRKKKLKLRPITYLSGSQTSASKLPTGYIWSPHLVPKPKDWGPMIDVVGFCFLNMSQDYEPSASLVSWLKAGPAPIYVGFGSLPVEDPEGMTQIIVDALSQTSQRGIIFKGWGGIGTLKKPCDSIYLLDNCPHDWLFPQCAAVVHHGGAGTTAAGLRAACPTTIVPFFGDQPFWGDRVHAKGVGPAPIPVGQFCLDKLVHAINFMMDPQVKERAVELAHAMEHENGVVGAVNAFHKHLPREMPKRAHSISSKTMMDHIAGFKLFQCFGSDMP